MMTILLLPVSAALAGLATSLQALPPVQWTNQDTTSPGFLLRNAPTRIYIDSKFASVRDTTGLTLIPPTAYEFAESFRSDISSLLNVNWTLELTEKLPNTGVILGPFRGNPKEITYEKGVVTEEGYELDVTSGRVYIGGTGARGMFWGTRTLLQELSILNGSLPSGRIIDAPAYATRGYLLDAGRKWYSPSFLKELCTYASFFKISEFHYHSSDNYPLNRGNNKTWSEVFSHFSLYPEQNTELRGLIQRPNETLSRTDFEDFQTHCAQRGITVIPEIEAPGHALAITKWKPELALAQKDLLNLTHPDAIPTVKAIWTEFLPWFQTKEVHIGADEYDSTLANDYINFVNDLSTFIRNQSGKRVRIWGTNEPSQSLIISKDIIIQHWQYGESNPIQLQNNGYDLINSEDWWAYMSLKNDHTPILPATYPQFYNSTRTLNFANVPDWQWDPSLFNPVNTTEQLPSGARGNKGAILAAWNDNGPEATTQLEAYYAMRDGIPVMAARAWSDARGVEIDTGVLADSIAFLAPIAPGQNLDRRFPNSADGNPTPSPALLSWTRPSAQASNTTMLGKGSYGPPYTLFLNVSSPFILSGPDTFLSLAASSAINNSNNNNSTATATATATSTSTSTINPPTYNLLFTTADNFAYPLRSTAFSDGHDAHNIGRIWTNQSSSSHGLVSISLPASLRIETDVLNGSRVWVDEQFVGRFEVFVYGGRNTLFSWSQMALVAPVERVEGGVEGLVLMSGGVGGGGGGGGGGSSSAGFLSPGGNGTLSVPVSRGAAGRVDARSKGVLVVGVALVVTVLMGM